MNTLFIIIGIPGSGKTTLAKKMEQDHWYEADTYPNLYIKGQLNASLLSEAHTMCKNNVESAMKQDIKTIVQSNTNLDLGEKGISPYIRLAEKYKYKVSFVLPEYDLMHYPHYLNQEKQLHLIYKIRSKSSERYVPPYVLNRMVNQFYKIMIHIKYLSTLSPPDMVSYLTRL